MRVVSLPVRSPIEWPGQRNGRWARELNDALVPAPGQQELIERLHSPGALVVTTGQQPGLLGGPLYTVHKALAAKALAERLSRDWKRPVVPIFWIAGDDHDYAEASEAAWIALDGSPVRQSLPPRPIAAPQLPMSREPLPGEIEGLISALAQALPVGDSRESTLAWLNRYYRPGTSFHAAFKGALAELLGSLGVLCLDPVSPAFKRAQIPWLERALVEAEALDRALADLPDAGTGIRAGDGASLVFLETAAGRDRLILQQAGFHTRRGGEHFSADSLLALLHREPERFSANVLLRPVIESALLPTVAYLAGPGEYRYLNHQARILYPLLNVERQVPVPRWSGVIVDGWADRLLQKLGLRLEQILQPELEEERKLIRQDLPPAVLSELDQLRAQLNQTRQTMITASGNDDGVIRAINGRVGHLVDLINELQRRFENRVRLRSETAWRQYRRLQDLLMPFGTPQERVLSVAAAYGRYGRDWLSQAGAAAGHWSDSLVDPTPVKE